MTVSQVHESLGTFSIKLKPNVPRDVLDSIEYFGHIAVIPGRLDARTYGDGTLDSARYVGVVRKKKISDNGTTNTDVSNTFVTLEGTGMNFWLGDEDDKGSIIEDEITFNSVNFSTAISGLLPPSVTAGTIGSVSGTYSGIHQWQTPRKAIQYVCDTMSQPPEPINLLTANNSSFEASGGVGGWTAASNCNIAVTGAYSYIGTKSMMVTPSSIGAMTAKTNGATNAMAVTAGDTYSVYYWLLPTGPSSTARIGIDYRDGSYVQQGSASTDTWLTLPQNAWTQVSRTFTVPTGAGITKADFLINLASTTSGDKFFVDYVWGFESVESTPVSYRVNNRGALDAGPESDLFVTTPEALLVRQGSMHGEDLLMKAVPGTIGLDQDMEDFATRVVILGSSDGIQFNVGESDIGSVAPGSNIYKDLHGNPLKLTRMVSESQTTETNADTRAELALRDVLTPHREVSLSTQDYDTFGTFDIGDQIYVYDPDSNLIDTANEVTVRGLRINPIKLQVTEMEWPVTDAYSIAYRSSDGTWYDLTDYLEPEEAGATKVVIGNFQRTLDSNLQSVQSRLGSNTAPDNSTPDQVSWVVGSFQAVAYLDKTGMARAQQKVAWSTPTNEDGSTVSDGAFYEIQYKLNTGHLYSQTWGAVSTLQWGNLNTWAQPVQASAVDWETRQVQWGTNALVINDLACGTAFDFRIRAIDTSNNIGDWSAVEIVVTAEDDIPPSQPSAPQVAASLIAIQVVHDLGENSGGAFNLERDIAYLEIHAEYEPGFVPSDDTKLGNLLANSSMLDAQTPAVGTFQISNTTAVYVKVVAVDRSGNRSSPSPSAEVTAQLIDNEHIDSLTVSKVTAGEITVDWLLSGTIRTGVDGQRLELNSQGLQAFNADGDLTTNLSSDPTSSGNYITFIGADGNAAASINSLGAGSFGTVNTNLLFLDGTDLGDLVNKRPKGVVAYGFNETNNITNNVQDQDMGFMELAFVAEANRMYKITCTGDMEVATSINGANLSTIRRCYFRVRDGYDQVPTITSDNVCTSFMWGPNLAGPNGTLVLTDIRTYTPGLHRLLWCFGSNDASSSTMLGDDGPAQFTIEDMGDVSLYQNNGYLNDGFGTTQAPDQSGNYAKTYEATGTRSYDGDGSLRSEGYETSRMYQGYYSSNLGHQKSLAIFDWDAMNADLVGVTIKKVEVFFYALHWFYDYGFAEIGTHDKTSSPSSYPGSGLNPARFLVEDWPIATGKWIEVPLAWGTEFQNGTSKGVMLGPAPNTDIVYYGYFQGGNTSVNRPKIRISYTK